MAYLELTGLHNPCIPSYAVFADLFFTVLAYLLFAVFEDLFCAVLAYLFISVLANLVVLVAFFTLSVFRHVSLATFAN